MPVLSGCGWADGKSPQLCVHYLIRIKIDPRVLACPLRIEFSYRASVEMRLASDGKYFINNIASTAHIRHENQHRQRPKLTRLLAVLTGGLSI